MDDKTNRLYIHDVVINKAALHSRLEHQVTTGSFKAMKRHFFSSVLNVINAVKYNDDIGTSLDEEYQNAVDAGDTAKAVRMLKDKAWYVNAEVFD